MGQQERSAAYQELKAAGALSKSYQQYTEAELLEDVAKLRNRLGVSAQAPVGTDQAAAAFFGIPVEEPAPHDPGTQRATPPVVHRDPNEMAGARLNTQDPDEPIRTDPVTGRQWFQEEVRKPAIPKPRGRRVQRYPDPGVVKKTVHEGDRNEFSETFEVPGDPANARELEVKITLPSYQVGIYKDPRFPFKTVCYNDNEGFEREGVQRFYGGAELVPASVKRKYVENVLCYDIRSVIAAIQKEARDLQLAGNIHQ
jgi:hypothetical protein